jgi:AcrR family transcriptional regulator
LGQIRDTERTRQRILDAAAKEFIQKGFDGATLFGIAQRARVSKQLIHHHFRSKDGLFQEVLDRKFRPMLDFQESVPRVTSDLIAERFKRRSAHSDYVRFLTWEAASGHKGAVPGHDTRQQRIANYAETLKLMQAAGRLPKDLDHKLLQLAIFSLSTYPMAFGQITRLVTGLSPTDARFQRRWYAFLRQLGKYLFK